MREVNEKNVMIGIKKYIKHSCNLSNHAIYAELFSVGRSTAIECCEKLGINPYAIFRDKENQLGESL